MGNKAERIYLNKKQKQKVGTRCVNCGNTEDLEYHHIVPVGAGGTNNISNFICLCYKCHQLLHLDKDAKTNHSELIKLGQKRAVENGSKMGAKRISIQRINPKIIYKIFRKDLNIDKITITDLCKKLGISREKYYRYIHLLKGERYHCYEPYDKYCSIITSSRYKELPNKIQIDVLQIGNEWNDDDKFLWINCIKEDEKLRIIGTDVYYLIDEINTEGYEYIIKYHTNE